jgi:hypothetical protein
MGPNKRSAQGRALSGPGFPSHGELEKSPKTAPTGDESKNEPPVLSQRSPFGALVSKSRSDLVKLSLDEFMGLLASAHVCPR